MDETKKNKLLSIGEASDYLGISIDTLRRWEKKGKVPTYRSPGGHRYFKKLDLENLFGTKYDRFEETPQSEQTSEDKKPETALAEINHNEGKSLPQEQQASKDESNQQRKYIDIPKISNDTPEDVEQHINISSEPDNIPAPNTTTTQPETGKNTTENSSSPTSEATNQTSNDTNTPKSNQIPQPETTSILTPDNKPAETGMLDNLQLMKLNNILGPENSPKKNKKTSKGYKMAVIGVIIFLIIDIILVFALISTPKVISPIP